jgi:fibrillarin-like pre-rRNA processing protein
MELLRDPGLYRKGKTLLTENLCPGESVYGETLEKEGDKEFRYFDPFHSKLAAYVVKGGKEWPFGHIHNLLYLGAGSGTTVSHISDILPKARLYAVERFPRPFASLLRMAKKRANLYPVLADAQMPEQYRAIPGEVDMIYQDVSQRNQVQILMENVHATLNPHGWVMLQLKTRSITQSEPPRAVLKVARAELEKEGMDVMDVVDLSPFSRDHYCLVLQLAK